MLQISTKELLQLAKEQGYLEAAICKLGLRATHFIEYWNGRYYDTGIDSQRYRTSARSLLANYPRTIWTID